MGDDARRLGAQQLRGVGVLLLRHDRGAGAPRVGELAEAELLTAPQDELGAEPRMRRRRRRGRQMVEGEVAIADGVERVGRRRRRSRARARPFPRSVAKLTPASAPAPSGSSAQGRSRRQSAPRRGAHPHVGEQVVSEVDGLRALKVRVARHRPVDVLLGAREQRPRSAPRARRARWRRGAHPHHEIARHLVVARACRCAACRRPRPSSSVTDARSPCECPRRRRGSEFPLASSRSTMSSPRSSSSRSASLMISHAASILTCARDCAMS